MTIRPLLSVLALPCLPMLGLVLGPPTEAEAQIPEEFENLQVLPEDISRDSLRARMIDITLGLGVRCGFCHVMGEGGSLEGARFALDERPEKERARTMLRMVETINDEILPNLPGREPSGPTVSCVTCHRQRPVPTTIEREIREALAEGGGDAAVARYRDLRERYYELGSFDFSERPVNFTAVRLAAEDLNEEAIALLEMNREFHPGSARIVFLLGQLYARVGRRLDAISAYLRVLELEPEHERAPAMLEELIGPAPDGPQ